MSYPFPGGQPPQQHQPYGNTQPNVGSQQSHPRPGLGNLNTPNSNYSQGPPGAPVSMNFSLSGNGNTSNHPNINPGGVSSQEPPRRIHPPGTLGTMQGQMRPNGPPGTMPGQMRPSGPPSGGMPNRMQPTGPPGSMPGQMRPSGPPSGGMPNQMHPTGPPGSMPGQMRPSGPPSGGIPNQTHQTGPPGSMPGQMRPSGPPSGGMPNQMHPTGPPGSMPGQMRPSGPPSGGMPNQMHPTGPPGSMPGQMQPSGAPSGGIPNQTHQTGPLGSMQGQIRPGPPTANMQNQIRPDGSPGIIPGYRGPAAGNQPPRMAGNISGSVPQPGQAQPRGPPVGGMMQQGPPGPLQYSPQQGAPMPGMQPNNFQYNTGPPSSSPSGPPTATGQRMYPQSQPPQGNMYPQGQQAPYGQQGGFPPQQGQAGYAPQGNQAAPRDPKQRIDPNQIPRPPTFDAVVRYHARGHTMTTPPAASCEYIITDDGCCSPRFIRPTLNHIPASKEIAKQCGISIAAIISPLARLHPEEAPIPMVDFGSEGPLRCNRCQAYVNSFTRFVQGGRKMECNICGMHSDTPRDYFCSLDEHGKRRDAYDRPELSKGTVDFVVPPAYSIRNPQEPIYVFVLDVTIHSVQSGLLKASIEAIQQCLLNVPEPERSLVGILTFDRHIQYYNLSSSDDTIPMYIVPDVLDPFAPVPPSQWLGKLTTIRDRIDRLCEQILESFENTTIADGCAGSALGSVVDALSACGGQVFLMNTVVSKLGIGRLLRKEEQRGYGTDRELPMYSSDKQNEFYKEIAKKASDCQIGINLLIVGKTYIDLATILQTCQQTGGSLYYAPLFGRCPRDDSITLQLELERMIQNTIGFEAVLKVRCSTGLSVVNHYGHFQQDSLESNVNIAVINSDKSIVVTFEHDEDLTEGQDFYIQAALLHTNIYGQRCVRVSNLALPVAPLLSNVFRYADLEATCSVYQHLAVNMMKEMNTLQTRDELLNQCVNVLYNYRKYCAANSSSGQLILPESLKLLPLYTLATLKSRAIRSNLTENPSRSIIDIRADERALRLFQLSSLPVEYAVRAVYPTMYNLCGMPMECGTFGNEGQLILPPSLPPTAERLDETGLFFVVTSISLHLYVTPKCDPNILLDVFGVEHVDTTEKPLSLLDHQSDLNGRIRTIVDHFMKKSPVRTGLEILTRNDWRCSMFMNGLIEDRTKKEMSYVEFLVYVHKKIQSRLS